MTKLPISIGILAWKSGQTLVDTIHTYYQNGLVDIVQDITILFQEVSEQDFQIAKHYGLNFIGMQNNIGIGMGLLKLAENCKYENILLLEHDWQANVDKQDIYTQLSDGIELLDDDFKTVRYRHRRNPGFPHFSILKYKDNELDYFDDYYKMKYPHLLDCIHWLEEPDLKFPEYIQKYKNFYISTSRYGNWTNNPCMYKKNFYIDTCTQFVNNDYITSEGEIAIWWANQSFKVAHGDGIFTHVDKVKYGIH